MPLNEQIMDYCERSVKRMVDLCEELEDEYGICCSPKTVPDSFREETTLLWLSEIKGPELEVRWGLAKERCGAYPWTAFIEISVDDDIPIPKEAEKFIRTVLHEDLSELATAFGIQIEADRQM
ncbi:MAG TPA: hypothetical protein VJ783_06680 [Pirellulales bacterium]|nr:hypothetical protein [Pirellulales bacterium]